MNKSPLKGMRELVRQVSARRAWPFLGFVLVGSLVIGAWLVVWPGATPPLRVPGNVLSFELGCVPASLDIHVKTRTAPIRSAAMVRPVQNSVLAYDVSSQMVDGATIIHLTLPRRSASGDNIPTVGEGHGGRAQLQLVFQRTSYVEVLRIESGPADVRDAEACPRLLMEGDSLRIASGARGAKLMRVSLIQERISDWCRAANDTVGNAVISMMAVSVMWLLAMFGRAGHRLYFASDEDLCNQAKQRTKQAPKELAMQGEAYVLSADYSRAFGRLAFARTVGPACGFALTVVALIAALHPDAQASQDAFQFVSALQVAMTATLVGLIIRIVAEFTIRIERECLYRVLALVRNPENGAPV